MRSRNFDAFQVELEGELRTRGRDEWIALMLAEGLAVSVVSDVADTLLDPQLHHRKMLATTINNTNGREYIVLGNPVKISGYRDSNWRPPTPALDEHGGGAKL